MAACRCSIATCALAFVGLVMTAHYVKLQYTRRLAAFNATCRTASARSHHAMHRPTAARRRLTRRRAGAAEAATPWVGGYRAVACLARFGFPAATDGMIRSAWSRSKRSRKERSDVL